MTIKKESLRERIRWWFYHPVFELIYLLGGMPRQHLNTMHYRNVSNVITDLIQKIEEANK